MARCAWRQSSYPYSKCEQIFIHAMIFANVANFETNWNKFVHNEFVWYDAGCIRISCNFWRFKSSFTYIDRVRQRERNTELMGDVHKITVPFSSHVLVYFIAWYSGTAWTWNLISILYACTLECEASIFFHYQHHHHHLWNMCNFTCVVFNVMFTNVMNLLSSQN